jgi:hypothetical protein
MDFSKAFDVVPHKRLMLKLDHYGIRGPTYDWICNFLMHRKQRVVVGGECSDWASVKSGVPQGTVLGPLLFLMYINDLPDKLTSNVRLFADDCVIYRTISGDNDADLLQTDLDRLSSWESTWQMKFNPEKCFVLKITHSNNPKTHKYILNNSVLQETESHTYLGVEIASSMKWNKHIDHMTAKGNRSLGFIKRNLHSCTEDIKDLAYRSLVRPMLEYCAAVWDPYTSEQIHQIEAVQRRAARFVKGDYGRRSSVTTMIKDLHWETLAHRRKISRLTVFHKAHEGHLSIPVQNLLHPVQRITRRLHSKSFIELQTSKDCYKFSFLPQTVIDWNNLPQHIISIEDPKAFKEQLKTHFQ